MVWFSKLFFENTLEARAIVVAIPSRTWSGARNYYAPRLYCPLFNLSDLILLYYHGQMQIGFMQAVPNFLVSIFIKREKPSPTLLSEKYNAQTLA